MGNHGCVNGSLEGVNYSSPVPIIGLYIAGVSFACMAVMLYDIIVAGVLSKKRWLPCKYFKLDSVSLTLLAVATKLSVDLTTPMPGRLDQLSKLTATAIICVAMGFVAPSLGVNGESECFTNMIALTIFVVTVAANIIAQLCTGVIVLFFVEHIIMLSLMFLLLLMLWHICFYIRTEKRIDSDRCRNLLSKGEVSMFEGLKLSSLYAYCSNPQFKISMYPMNAAIGTICVACLGIIIETGTRSLILKRLKFCDGDSDYSWSMPVIVYVQIATVVVGTIAIFVRWVLLFSRMDLEIMCEAFVSDGEHVNQMKKTLRAKGISWRKFWNSLVFIIRYTVLIAQVIIVFPSQIVRDCIFCIKKPDNNLEFFEEGGDAAAIGYIVGKGLDDMMRSMKKVAKSNSQNDLSHFLTINKPSEGLNMDSLKITNGIDEIEVCSLSVALLVKLAQALIPKEDLVSLLDAFYEAKEVLHFIDKTIQPKSSKNNNKLAYAESVWRDGDFTYLLPDGIHPVQDLTLAVAKETLNDLNRILHSGDVWGELGSIINYINSRDSESIGELYACIKQLFVDMLHMLYAQLPNAIYKSLRACPAEEFEESARTALEFLFKIQSLKCQDKWLVPAGISSIINDNEPIKKLSEAVRKRLREVVLVRRDSKFQIIKAPTEPSVASTSAAANSSLPAVVLSRSNSAVLSSVVVTSSP